MDINIEQCRKKIFDLTGEAGIRYLANGKEGLIFASDRYAYKIFPDGISIFQEGQLDFIKEKILQKEIPHLVPLRAIFENESELIFKMDYINGLPYTGGYLSQLRGLLISLKQNHISHRNIHPRNLMVASDELILCDLGRSLFPLTEKEFREMLKRTYLTHEFFEKPDLSELMTQSLTQDNMKELHGLRYFERTLEQSNLIRYPVSLLIKASPIEWQTIDFQVRHIVGQLTGPARFAEVIVITDRHEGPFLRQYARPDHGLFFQKLSHLKETGWIDEIIYAPLDEQSIRDTYHHWFGLECTETHAERGHHVHSQLYGFDNCKQEYILQIDSDCLIARRDFSHDYLADMINIFEKDPRAITVPFRIAEKTIVPYHRSDNPTEWRTEARCSLLKKDRLFGMRPLPNRLNSKDKLVLPWHRSLDQVINTNHYHSYRGSDNRTFFIHVPNSKKSDVRSWFEMINLVERCAIPGFQNGMVDLEGDLEDWVGTEHLAQFQS